MKHSESLDMVGLSPGELKAFRHGEQQERARWVAAVNEVKETVNDGMIHTRIAGPVALNLLLEKMEATQ